MKVFSKLLTAAFISMITLKTFSQSLHMNQENFVINPYSGNTKYTGNLKENRPGTYYSSDEYKHFLEKSRMQKTAAWLLMGSGVVATGTGVVLTAAESLVAIGDAAVTGKSSSTTSLGPVIVVGGLVMIGSSIPLFISARKNKNKAMLVMKSEKVQLLPQLKTNEWQVKTGIAINF